MLEGTRNKVLAGIAAVAFIVAGIMVWRNLREPAAVSRSRDRLFICAKTGKSFEHKLQAGDLEPIYSPYSKANTGYHAELCFWTKGPNGEWKAKLDPTPVLLRRFFEPGAETHCPDCGHIVVDHNPKPPQKLMEAAEKEAND